MVTLGQLLSSKSLNEGIGVAPNLQLEELLITLISSKDVVDVVNKGHQLCGVNLSPIV